MNTPVLKVTFEHSSSCTQAILKVGRCRVASVNLSPKAYGAYISELNVHKVADYRKGYGAMLMNSVLENLKCKVKLDVLESNIAAVELYKKLGFCFNGKPKNSLLTMIKECVQ